MKKYLVLLIMLSSASINAVIDFGNQESSLTLRSGLLNVGGIEVGGGSIVVENADAVTIVGSADGYPLTYKTNIGDILQEVNLVGTISFTDGDITLWNESELFVQKGGLLTGPVSVLSHADYPARIAGSGDINYGIVLGSDTEAFVDDFGMAINWQGPCRASITGGSYNVSTALYLENDLEFLPGAQFIATPGALNTIYFDLHSMSLSFATIEHGQVWVGIPRLRVVGPVLISDGATVYLNGEAAYIEGDRETLTFSGSGSFATLGCDVSVTNIHLDGVSHLSFFRDETAETGNFLFRDVVCSGPENIATFGLESVIASGADVIDFFSEYGVTLGDSRIRLMSDVVLLGTWSATGQLDLIGDNFSFDASAGGFTVDAGEIVRIQDMTITVSESSLAGEGTYEFSNATVIFSESVNWSSATFAITVTGPTTFVVGGNTIVMPADCALTNDTTVWIDDLGLGGTITGIIAAVNGRVEYVSIGTLSAPTDLVATSDYELTENIYLYAADESTSRTMTFSADPDTTLTLDGHGRSVVFSQIDGDFSKEALFVDAGVSVAVVRTTFDNFIPGAHVSDVSSFTFGDGSRVNLGDDCSIDGMNFIFGSAVDTVDETMILDLQGHTLMLGESILVVQGGDGIGSGNHLRIKNGKIIGVAVNNIQAMADCSITFENVDLVLGYNFGFESGRISFDGHCSIACDYNLGYTFEVSSTDIVPVTILANSRLTLKDAVTFSHNTAQEFYCEDTSSELEMIGATFTHPNSVESLLEILQGTIIIDHKAAFIPGAGGMTLAVFNSGSGGDVNLIIRPGSQLIFVGDGAMSLYYT